MSRATVDLDDCPTEADFDEAMRQTHPIPVTLVPDEVPEGLLAFARSRCRQSWLLDRVVKELAEKVLRRLLGRLNSPENRARRWASAWSDAGQARTMGRIVRIRNQIVRHVHLENVEAPSPPLALPRFLRPWRPNALGQLVVDDPRSNAPSLGSTPYLEQTPPKVFRWLHETWLSRRLLDDSDDVGLEDETLPKVWDLTAGSGTGLDYFGSICGCDVAATDLIDADARTVRADCRSVGEIDEHGSPSPSRLMSRAGVVIPSPDLVLFDPPSMGIPSHTTIYRQVVDPKDLSFLGRYNWVFTVAKVVERAIPHLADDGLLSLFLRLGTRNGSTVQEDPALLNDFKEVLGDRALVVHEMPIVYRRVQAQAGLGKARVPAVHLTLMRSR